MSLKPTDAATAILNVLWQDGPCTVREVHGRMDERGVRYTTVLKQLQVMHDKGLVKRDDTSRSHRYWAAVSQEETQTVLLHHLLEKAFGGSTTTLFIRALSRVQPGAAELAEIKSLLDTLSDG